MISPTPPPLDHGYFVDSDDECDVEYEAEPCRGYESGQYLPIQIGETLGSRYVIEHKLGWGGFATVWLARDIDSHEIVALKIADQEEGQAECDVQRQILQAVPDASGLVTYRTAFAVPGPQGRNHLGIVYPLLGPHVRGTLYRIPAVLRMSAARPLLHALATLHSAGFVHRDLNMANVLWEMESIQRWTKAQIYERFGRPQKMDLGDLQGKHGELVAPMLIPLNMIRPQVSLADFGLAVRRGDAVSNTIHGPLAFCAPERLHGEGPTSASDMWSYMSIFASLYIGVEALWGGGPPLMTRLVDMLGPFPGHWKGSYTGPGKASDWWYNTSNRGHPPIESVDSETMEEKIDRLRPEITPAERNHALSVVRKGFSYSPENRISARQLLEDPSFVALMEIYESSS